MRRHYAAAVALLVLGVAAPAAQSGKQADAALTLVRAYLAQWQDTLAALVTEEDYRQELSRGRQELGRGPGSFSRDRQQRRLRSDLLLLLRAPAEGVWLSFRDVIAVDGDAVRDRQKRFDALFLKPADTVVTTAERIALEGARFNLGRPRTVNTPTAAFIFLSGRYDANTIWHLDANGRLDGRHAWRLRFAQQEPPYAITIPGVPTHAATGSFWVEPATGAILKWELRVRARGASFRVMTSYGTVPSIAEGRVPLRMEEDYDSSLEVFNGVATYSKHRLFRTAGRIIGF